MKALKILLPLALIITAVAFQAAARESTAVPVESFFKYDKTLPLDPQVEIISDTDSCTKYHFWLRTTHERRIPGILVIPKNRPAPAPVVFLQHGIHSDKEFMLDYGAQYLLDAGFAVVGIDAEYHGERKIDASGSEFKHLYLLRELFVQTVIDIGRTIDYLEQRKDADAGKVAYLGHSMGSLIGVIAAGVDKRIKATILLGTGDFAHSYGPVFRYIPEYEYIAPVIEPLNFAGAISPRPLLIIQGKKDNGFPGVSTEKLFEAAGEPKKIVWLDGGHLPPADEVMPITIEWLNKYLYFK